METMADITYQGPAVLIPKGQNVEYQCGVRIRVWREISDFDDVDADRRELYRWDADIVGSAEALMPCPPFGEATLRLPDGSTGEAMFNAVQPTESSTWAGALSGMGRSPAE